MHFLISGSDKRVGKTMLGCALAFAFKIRGMRVGVMKPVETGCTEADGATVPRDGTALIASASSDLPTELVTLYHYRSALPPAAAAEADPANPPSYEAICRAYREIATRSDVTLVEDCGGLAAPIDWNNDYADLALALGLELIFVVANRGAFISAARLATEYGMRRGIRIRGLILNALDAEASAAVQRDADFLARATRVSCLGTVRFKEPVSQKIVEQLLRVG
jgi:dethiobiotin synthetase